MANSYWTEVLADSPTLVLKMDEASGNLSDSSGSGYSAVSNGGTLTYQQTGPGQGIPYGILFGGGHFSITDSGTGLDLGDGPFSIEFWFKRTQLTTTKYILGKTDATLAAAGYEVEVRNGAPDSLRLGNGTSGTNTNTSGAVIDDTNWHHAVLTRGSSANGQIYLDGVSVAISTGALTFSDNNLALIIGNLYSGFSGAWDGYLAGLALYKSNLSATRVYAHFAARDVPASPTGPYRVDNGIGGNNSAATSLTITPQVTLEAGAFGVLVIAADNAGSGGSTTVMPSTITDSAGNTWTRRLNPIYDPGLASAGVDVGFYTAPITTQLTTAGSIVVSWAAGVSVTAKAWALHTWLAPSSTFAYGTGAAGTGAASGAPTVTTSSITSGDIVVGGGGVESADTWIGDGDTTNGFWSVAQHTGFGTGTSGMAVIAQSKLVTATATQSYDPTLTSADQIIGWISIGVTAVVTGDWAGRRAPTVALQAVNRAGVV